MKRKLGDSNREEDEAKELENLIAKHRRHPGISVEEYVQATHIAVGRSLASRKPIYLDTKFWLYFRDAELNRTVPEGVTELLGYIREKVSAGIAFCPLSDVTLIEILKQDDSRCRLATAKLVDELGLGVALAPQDLRVRTEIAHFIHEKLLELDVLPLTSLVWQSATFSLGIRLPVLEWMTAEDSVAIRKAFFDRMSGCSLSEVLELSQEKIFTRLPFERLATKLNELNKNYESEVTSFSVVYEREVLGTVDLFVDTAVEVVQERGVGEGILAGVKNISGKSLRDICFAALSAALLSQKYVRDLPALHVMCATHAQQRWDKRRSFKANDIPDFDHAAAAVPYCSAFLTEKPLAAFLKNGAGKIASLHSCEVFADPREALAGLTGMLASN